MVCRQFGRREDITYVNTDFKLQKTTFKLLSAKGRSVLN